MSSEDMADIAGGIPGRESLCQSRESANLLTLALQPPSPQLDVTVTSPLTQKEAALSEHRSVCVCVWGVLLTIKIHSSYFWRQSKIKSKIAPGEVQLPAP